MVKPKNFIKAIRKGVGLFAVAFITVGAVTYAGTSAEATPIQSAAVVQSVAKSGGCLAHHTKRFCKINHARLIVKAQKGDPYVYGAAGPDAFDCSGLMMYSFGKAGLYLPRSAQDQYNYVRHIPLSQAVRGDFLYYHDSSGHVFHAAMFAGRVHGGGIMWEAPRTGLNVRRVKVWQAPRYAGTLRLN
jgi:cell wall-associated NlpC family hydrolase